MIDIGSGGGVKYPNWRGCCAFICAAGEPRGNSSRIAGAVAGAAGAGGPGRCRPVAPNVEAAARGVGSRGRPSPGRSACVVEEVEGGRPGRRCPAVRAPRGMPRRR